MNQMIVDATNLDYGYSNIQNTYSGSASETMFFPTGSNEWLKEFTKNDLKK
jgi:hypothetical protein